MTERCGLRRTAAAALLAALLNPAGALAEWRAERVTGEVAVRHGDTSTTALADGAPVASGSMLRLHEGGALTLWRDGARLRTRAPAELRIHADGPGTVPRLQLLDGAVRAEVPSGLDLRVNAGALRLQMRDGEAWFSTGATHDRVCALRGAVAVQVPDKQQTLYLRETGACLARGPDGALLHERPGRNELNARLARADSGSRPLPVTYRPPPLPASDAATGQTQPVPVPDAGPAAGPAQPANAENGWYIVVGAFSERVRAEALLRDDPVIGSARGAVLPIAGSGLVRAAIGPFGSRAEAERQRAALAARHPGAWLLEPGSTP